ncbi:MAG: hypothetical protein NVSMB29_07380 [Candidatus Dormibacteria bacterium]
MAAGAATHPPIRADAPRNVSVVAPTGPDLTTAVDQDRRSGIERIIELGRWVVLIFVAVTVNFPGQPTANRIEVDIVLVGWGMFNLAATFALVARSLPGRRTQYAMTAVDVLIATVLVFLTGGFGSNLGLAFYVVIIASSLRFGLGGSLVCAAVISVLHLSVGGLVAGGISRAGLDTFITRLFLYFVVALTSGLLARELVTSRARQMTHTFQLEHVAFAELREVDRIKSEFMMLASHELRTPLAKIKGWLTLMQEAGDRLPVEAREEGLLELRMEAEHLGRLTDNLLCIAQLESGEIRMKTGVVEVDDLFESVITRFIEVADRNRFVCTVAPDARRVRADGERLALVLACLVDNALKFSPDDETVTIITRRVGEMVQVEVTDRGRRIPDDQVEKVFASFYQVESPLVRQRGGFGVGLYLARQLVDGMGGRIWVDNTRSRGNSFVVALPCHV